MKHQLVAGIALALLAVTHSAWAGRPLATDDAGTAERGACQIESWVERTDADHRALVLAPACGIAEGLELGADYTLPDPQETLRASAGLALKWVPEAWHTETAAGRLNFGLKFSTAYEHPTDADWRGTETGVLGLVTLQASEAWTVHANLGAARERSSGTTGTLLNLALVWTPRAEVLLFAESRANDQREVFGGTVNSAGARWWLIPERFGLDLTASREVGADTATVWTVGFGWYGLAW